MNGNATATAPAQGAAETGEFTVYMTTDISTEGLMAAYNALGWTPTGKTVVKVSTGEPPASNYLDSKLIQGDDARQGGSISRRNPVGLGERYSLTASEPCRRG